MVVSLYTVLIKTVKIRFNKFNLWRKGKLTRINQRLIKRRAAASSNAFRRSRIWALRMKIRPENFLTPTQYKHKSSNMRLNTF
jgi:hypothetical protein